MIFLIFFFFHEYLNDCAIVIYVLSFSKKKKFGGRWSLTN